MGRAPGYRIIKAGGARIASIAVFSTSTGSVRSRPKWLVPVIAVGAVFLLVVLPLIASYNGMVNKQSSVDQSFAGERQPGFNHA